LWATSDGRELSGLVVRVTSGGNWLDTDVAACPALHELRPNQAGNVLDSGVQVFEFHLLQINREFQVEAFGVLAFAGAIRLVQGESVAKHLGNANECATAAQGALGKSAIRNRFAVNAHDYALQGNCA